MTLDVPLHQVFTNRTVWSQDMLKSIISFLLFWCRLCLCAVQVQVRVSCLSNGDICKLLVCHAAVSGFRSVPSQWFHQGSIKVIDIDTTRPNTMDYNGVDARQLFIYNKQQEGKHGSKSTRQILLFGRCSRSHLSNERSHTNADSQFTVSFLYVARCKCRYWREVAPPLPSW